MFWLLGCDTAAAATGLFDEVEATGGTEGAARRRYSSNQWLKHESYLRLSGVHGACSESIWAASYKRASESVRIQPASITAPCSQTITSVLTSSRTMSTSQPQTTQEEAEITALVASLQARLVASGEWGRLQKQLRRSLDGSQWDKDLKDFARGA